MDHMYLYTRVIKMSSIFTDLYLSLIFSTRTVVLSTVPTRIRIIYCFVVQISDNNSFCSKLVKSCIFLNILIFVSSLSDS